MPAIDTGALFHKRFADYWREREAAHVAQTRQGMTQTRFERIVAMMLERRVTDGERTLARIRGVFFDGLKIKWSTDQIRVFNACLFASLPLIYGSTWGENKATVLKQWNNAKRECPYTLVMMARRNGKTFVVSGFVVSMLFGLGVNIAIFSTCKRTAQLMMSAVVDMMEQAFEVGTHVNRQDFVELTRNTEKVELQGPDRTKRIVGCFPGSVKVSQFFFVHPLSTPPRPPTRANRDIDAAVLSLPTG